MDGREHLLVAAPGIIFDPVALERLGRRSARLVERGDEAGAIADLVEKGRVDHVLLLSKRRDAGQLIGEYTVELRNDGPSDATGVEVTDQIPVGLEYVSHTASQGAILLVAMLANAKVLTGRGGTGE